VSETKYLINSIKKDYKNKRYYTIFLDNGETFQVSNETLLKYDIKEKCEITNDIIKKAIDFDEQLVIKNKIIVLLSYRMRSKYELNKYFLSKGFNNENILLVIKELETRKYLSDLKFAKMYCKHLIKEKMMGEYLVSNKLLNHQIPKSLSEPILSELYNTYTPQFLINKILEKKKYTISHSKEKKIQIINYLKRRGFSWDDIISSLSDNALN
tara:strand:- start:586 stop:1221 length:636 start_codon:yes stop_codon:yes gene_type:complete